MFIVADWLIILRYVIPLYVFTKSEDLNKKIAIMN